MLNTECRQKLKNLLPDRIKIKDIDEDIDYFYNKINDNFDFFVWINDDRKVALIALCFYLGYHEVMTYKSVFYSLEHHQYQAAALSLLKHFFSSDDYAIKIAEIISHGHL